jgi:hypothetical protein
VVGVRWKGGNAPGSNVLSYLPNRSTTQAI